MGLDAYLDKAKRIKGAKLEDLVKLNEYFDYMVRPNKYKNHTMEEWGNRKLEDVNLNIAKDYITEYKHRYSSWDKEKKYGYSTLFQNVAYWRKANHIHKWFVDNVQNGEDDCGFYEVTKEQLEELLEICVAVRDNSKLVNEDGNKYIKNPSLAESLLPTQDGFFFGGTSYDEWYLYDIRYTIRELRKILRTTDFEHEIVFYTSSW